MAHQGFRTSLLAKSIAQTLPIAQSAPSLRIGLTALLVFTSGIGLLNRDFAIAVTPTASTTVAQTPLNATLLYVNPAAGEDVPNAGRSEASPYRSITYAMQQAQPGTIVQLARGSYTTQTGEVFPILIPAGVTLRGSEAENGQTVAIIGGGTFISKTFARQNTTLRTAGKSEIRGVSVTNPNVRGTGIWIESNDAIVVNSTFSNNNREGIFVTGTANPKIEKNVFLKNGGNGISVANYGKGEIRENLFQNTGFGVAVSENGAPTLVGNRFTENVDGLYLNDTAKPILRNNVIENNRRDGIVITGAAQPDLGSSENAGNNIIRNNAQYQIENSTSQTVYSIGNTIEPATKIAGRIEFSGSASGGTEQPGQSAFADVQGHWAQAYIEALAKRNIISGFPGSAFRPNDPVTRVQYAAIISKAFNPAAKQPAVAFKDINSSFWGYQPIQTVVRGGFMKGYPEGLFKPDERIPRVQVLVALSSGLGFPTADNTLNLLSLYSDSSQIPTWARNAVASATLRKIVVNYPTLNQFNPNRDATRAEVAALVYQALVANGQASALPSPYIVAPQ